MGDTDDPLIGQAVGGYRLARCIGQGGMGAVYLGVHPTLGKRVAVKVILHGQADRESSRDRFLEEAKLASSLEHAAIVEVIDLAALPDGRLYMVMELLEGEPLGHMMARRGPLPPGEATAIAAEALSGLAAAHARGMVHRDIKPANLFVVRAGERGLIKILDFGVAKLFAAPAAGRTASGAIVGTPGYMAPEQTAPNRPVEAPADVYAMGVVLYEMLAGRPPFASDDWVELLHLHRSTAPPPLDGVPDAIEAVVIRALAKAPAQRFPDAGTMREALLAAVGGAAALPPVPVPEISLGVDDLEDAATRTPEPPPPARDAATRALRKPPEARVHAPLSSSRRRRAVAIAGAGGLAAVAIAWAAWPRGSSPAGAAPIAADARVGDARAIDAGAIDAGVIDAPPELDAALDMFTVETIPDAAAFDFRAHLPDMEALARRIYPDARLVSMLAQGLRPDGTLDLTGHTSSSLVKYTFRSEAHSAAGGLKTESRLCLVWVTAHDGVTQVTSIESDCSEPFLELRCDGPAMMKGAFAQGAPHDWLATVMLKPGTWGRDGWQHDGPAWELWFGDKYFYVRNADCATK